ncbi:MAG: CvpA family protein [Limisphaerales bacterium]
MSLDKLPFGWFDILLAAVLVCGLFRGRKSGMTKEMLPMLQWVAIVVISGLGYTLAGSVLGHLAGLREQTGLILGYLTLAFLVFLIFSFVKKTFASRLEGSNLFGRSEYYLGMLSGMVRFGCVLFFAMALLNAPVYSAAEVEAHNAYIKRWYGGGIYKGNYFPTLQNVQESVFKNSFTGPLIKNHLGALLINTVSPNGTKKTATPQTQSLVHIGN